MTITSEPRPAAARATTNFAPLLRRLPHNVDAEMALLGAILLNNRAFERVSDFLRPEHFVLTEHARVFDVCSRTIERGQIADPVTLKGLFEQDEALAQVGGMEYLARLAECAATPINAGEYGRLVYDLFVRRELIALGEDVVNRAYSSEIEERADQQIEIAEQGLFDLATKGAYDGGFEAFNETLASALKMAEAAHKRQGLLSGAPTGFRDLDGKLGGLHPSDLIILAGRPSIGKTALATNIAFNAALKLRREAEEPGGPLKTVDGAIVGFFSLEMSREQIATRILAEETQRLAQARGRSERGIPSDHIRRGKVANDKFSDLVLASRNLQRLPMFIDDTPALSISAMRTRARRLKRQHGLGLIVIDYLQLIAPSPGSRHESRVQELSEITRGLKALAKELNVPVLALSQLSRAVEQREDKRPQLADLRESGTIEQDSDVVMFVFREEYYIARQQPDPHATDKAGQDLYDKWQEKLERVANKAEVIIAKQRHGPIGNIHLHFDAEFTLFRDLELNAYPDT